MVLGSLAVQSGDHLRSGIICGPIWGSFAVSGSFAALYRWALNRKSVYSYLFNGGAYWKEGANSNHRGKLLFSTRFHRFLLGIKQ